MREVEKKPATILIVEDDPGHAALIEKNLRRAGIGNRILLFEDGQKILDFLLPKNGKAAAVGDESYVLLLDIRLPKVDGVEVLRRIKSHGELRKVPVIMLTTTDDPREIERCHAIGCSHYIRKPVAYEEFVAVLQRLGFFLMIVDVPVVRKDAQD